MKIAIIHGKKSLSNGSLHPEFTARLEIGLQLFKQNKVNKFIVSGGSSCPGFPSEAELGYRFLVARNIPPSKIIKLENVFTALDEVIHLSPLCQRIENLTHVAAIMSSWPLFRTRLIYYRFWQLSVPVSFVSANTYDYLFYALTEPFAIFYALIYSPQKPST